MARIIDISDEKNPRIVSKLKLEIHNPANCSKIAPDLPGLRDYVYGTHYCSVDDMQDASILACGMFSSGIRVYDIRNPLRPERDRLLQSTGGYVRPAGFASELLYTAP